MQTTCCIKKNIVIAVVFSKLNCLFSDMNRIFITHFKNRNANLLTDNLKLLNSRRTVNVTSYKKGSVSFFF